MRSVSDAVCRGNSDSSEYCRAMVGDRSRKKTAAKIDLIGEPVWENSYQPAEYIVCSCKFRNRPADMRELKELMEYSQIFAAHARLYYYIFSAFGFTDELEEAAEQSEEVRLISLEEMF